ncbi:transcriptional regulator, LysR family [Acidovorax delafieldii 2AN]|uniref:Transcriptional regulator, LysR family n=1 Tax=Acidovorax delafieldii 2AN TaxID=573060 RepID=C5T3U9_ACIDE|nr:LysR family transcriptional regulator [Acidovorax delafieldii]EER60870.1 transcriptional regulator, LysR family [Acidovorax delafieldii 2AN]
MPRENYNDLTAFITVARERSFTRAASQLGVSQSALSHSIRAFETKLGVRLLTRTTRSVSPTDAGERLLRSVAPQLDEIEAEVATIRELQDKPAGLVRVTTAEHAAETILWPKLEHVLPAHPDFRVEVCIDYGLTDIVADRFDAGIRLGHQVAKGMTAVRISPDISMAVVGSPSYFERHARPRSPHDLTQHNCINLRFPTSGGLYAWELEKDGSKLNVRVDGQLVLNNLSQILGATLAGLGLCFIPEDIARPHIETGRLKQVLKTWCPKFPGYHLYYPSRRHSSRALSFLVETLHHRK